jgi:FkbM family methyltransferase
MILFDIGANRGDAVIAGLTKRYKVIALEPAPRIYAELVKNFIYNPNVIPLRFAVSDTDYERIKFYEADEDGLSTINKDWLTDLTMPYANKPFRTIQATTITIDTLAKIYGEPDLIKIDVEGAEWSVFKGLSKVYPLTFEWTQATLDEHHAQLDYLMSLGYTEFAPQFIEHHLQEPDTWYKFGDYSLWFWWRDHYQSWQNGGWKVSGLRPTPDAGMCWVR